MRILLQRVQSFSMCVIVLTTRPTTNGRLPMIRQVHHQRPGEQGLLGTPKTPIAAAMTTLTAWTSDLHQQLSPIAFCLAMAADLLLTASLIRILHRKRTGFKGYVETAPMMSRIFRELTDVDSTDNMIDVLVLYSVNTGARATDHHKANSLYSLTLRYPVRLAQRVDIQAYQTSPSPR